MSTERTLETRRLFLEPLLPAHAGALYDSLLDRRLYSYITQRPPDSLAALERRFRNLSSRRSADGNEVWLNWAMRLKNAAYIGWLQATVQADASADIAYLVFPDHWRQGYAKEACEYLLDHLRADHKVSFIAATVDTENAASIRLLESLGFTRVRTGIALDFLESLGERRLEHRYEKRSRVHK